MSHDRPLTYCLWQLNSRIRYLRQTILPREPKQNKTTKKNPKNIICISLFMEKVSIPHSRPAVVNHGDKSPGEGLFQLLLPVNYLRMELDIFIVSSFKVP